ncbi:MAG TPA: (2Fe-2S) ferredoxin domain-containing protein [Nitrospiria bacterium]|nr:(2Fe-2S) ferredoxin domain-containing protein [Nitrospiria bacterium]
MSRFKHHIFVCTNVRSADDARGCCSAKGSEGLRDYFKAEIKKRGLKGMVRANQAGCLDACAFGPSVVVYPEGVWYTVRTEADAREILDCHIEKGEVVARLLMKYSKGKGN